MYKKQQKNILLEIKVWSGDREGFKKEIKTNGELVGNFQSPLIRPPYCFFLLYFNENSIMAQPPPLPPKKENVSKTNFFFQ